MRSRPWCILDSQWSCPVFRVPVPVYVFVSCPDFYQLLLLSGGKKWSVYEFVSKWKDKKCDWTRVEVNLDIFFKIWTSYYLRHSITGRAGGWAEKTWCNKIRVPTPKDIPNNIIGEIRGVENSLENIVGVFKENSSNMRNLMNIHIIS